MASVDKPKVLSDWLKWESAPEKMFSREKVTVLSGENLVSGAVVGKITASGKVVAYNDGNNDGSEVAYGVLYLAVDASAADKEGVVIVRDAIVDPSKLTFEAGVDEAAALSALAEKNILSDRGAA